MKLPRRVVPPCICLSADRGRELHLDKALSIRLISVASDISDLFDKSKNVRMEGKMSRRSTKIPTCSPLNKEGSDWRVESIVSIDERGQMVLPKELRDKAKIRAGDKLALISWDKGGRDLLPVSDQDRTSCRACEGFPGPHGERSGFLTGC